MSPASIYNHPAHLSHPHTIPPKPDISIPLLSSLTHPQLLPIVSKPRHLPPPITPVTLRHNQLINQTSQPLYCHHSHPFNFSPSSPKLVTCLHPSPPPTVFISKHNHIYQSCHPINQSPPTPVATLRGIYTYKTVSPFTYHHLSYPSFHYHHVKLSLAPPITKQNTFIDYLRFYFVFFSSALPSLSLTTPTQPDSSVAQCKAYNLAPPS